MAGHHTANCPGPRTCHVILASFKFARRSAFSLSPVALLLPMSLIGDTRANIERRMCLICSKVTKNTPLVLT